MNNQSKHKFNFYLSAFGLLAFLLIVLGLAYSAIEQRTRHRHTCALCRLERIDYGSTLHQSESEIIENKCSQWYLREVEKTHEHIWVANPTIQLLDVHGNVIGAGDSESRPGRMIWRLSPDEQIQIYQNSESYAQANEILKTLASPASITGDSDRLLYGKLRDWIDSGFQEQPDFMNEL